MTYSTPQEAYKAALGIVGSQAEMERLTGEPQENFSYWLRTAGRKRPFGTPPSDLCPAIERATGGQVTREMLRPDVFSLDQRLPEASQ